MKSIFFFRVDMTDSNPGPLKMEQNNKLENSIHPLWLATSIYDFYHFCCPECDEKTQDKQEFVNHASAYHKGVSFRQKKLFYPVFYNMN